MLEPAERQQRLAEAEEALEALRREEVDAVVGGQNILLLRLREAERKLRESEELYRLTFDAAPVGIAHRGLDGRWLRFNNAVCSITGYSRDELEGLTAGDLAHPEDFDTEQKQASRLLSGEIGTYSMEQRYLRKDGAIIWVKLMVSLRDAQGAPLHFILVMEEINERKQIEQQLIEAKALLETLLTEAPVGFAYLDRELRYVLINKSLADINGVPVADHIGKRVHDILPPIVSNVEAMARQIVSTGQAVKNHEFCCALVPGTPRYWKESWYPVHDMKGDILGFGVIVEEITERKRIEEELHETDQRKNEFLALLAHELRNPLAPLRTLLEIMKRSEDKPDVRQKTYDTMEHQLGHMIRLVDDLLDMGRISRGTIGLRTERTEVAAIIRQAVEVARPLYDTSGHELIMTLPSEPIYLNADPTRLAQVLGNLLSNAWKFTPRGGAIQVGAEHEDGQAAIRIQDNGSGIAAEELPHIFEMFRQVHAPLEREHGGLGLGLTLVKTLVELHNGTVEARSAGIGHGAEFIVRLPAVSDPSKPASHEGSAADQSAIVKRRILVVDDNRAAADSLSMLLKMDGHEVHTAYDGLEALEMAARVQPDFILLDLGLPKLNGYEVARRIRERDPKRNVALVALTGWSQEEVRSRAEEAGFDAHITKPVHHTELKKLLARRPVEEKRES